MNIVIPLPAIIRRAALYQPWQALALMLSGAMLMIGFNVRWIANFRREQSVVLAERRELHPAEPSASAGTGPSSVNPPDFVQRLPAMSQADPVMSELRRAVAAAGATLREVQIRSRPASADRLGQSEFGVSLRGRYPQVRQVVGDLLSRFSNVTLQRLTTTTSEGGLEAEFALTLIFWTRPDPGQAMDGS